MPDNTALISDWSKPKETLDTIKSNILAAIKKEEEWYANSRKEHAILTRIIRFFAILLFAFGILYPILSAGVKDVKEHSLNLNWGYISLALGGLLLLFDKYFGISSGFVRFYIAELDIKKNTLEFIENWEIEIVKSNNNLTQECILNLLNIVKIFRQAIYTIIQTETGTWASEFQAQTGELQELFKQKQDEYKSQLNMVGNISVIIENYDAYSDIEIVLDEAITHKLNGATSTIYRNVSVGPHQVLVRAKKEENIISFSKNVDVTISNTIEVIMKLP